MLKKLPEDEVEETKREMIARKVKKVKFLTAKAKRTLSPHVASRWYRAPKLILLEKKYDQAVDIWALGCVLYEMLSQNCLANNSENRQVLFMGDSCFPLSPGDKTKGV